MIRLVKVAKDNAVKARSTAMISLKTVLVTASAPLREQLQPLTRMALIRRCASLRPGPIVDVTAASQDTLRSIAKRCLELDAEITEHGRALTELATDVAPDLIVRPASGLTAPPSCSSSSATTPAASARRPPSPASAASHPSRRPPG